MAFNLGDLVFKLRADGKELIADVTKQGKAAGEKFGEGFASFDFGKVGSKLTKGLTAPLAGLAVASVKGFADLNKKLAEVVTLTGLTGDAADAAFDRFRSGVEELSSELGVAQSTLVDGLYQSLSAGVPEETVFDFLAVAGELAVAGVTDTETAVTGLTKVINNFGLDASDAEAVADSLFTAVKDGQTTVEELSNAVASTASSANTMTVSFQENNAALSTLSDSLKNSELAASSLNAAYTSLTNDKVTAVFQQLGFDSAAAAIEQEGLAFALNAVAEASGGTQAGMIALLGSTEAVKAVNILAGAGAEDFAQALDNQATAAGAVGAAFDEIDKARGFERLVTDVQNLGLAVGETLLPFAEGAVDAIGGIVEVLSALPDGVLVGIGGIAAVAGPALIAIGKLRDGFQSIKGLNLKALFSPQGLGLAAAGVGIALLADQWFKARQRAQEFAANVDLLAESIIASGDAAAGAADDIEAFLGSDSSPFAGQTEALNDLGLSLADIRDGLIDGTLAYNDFAAILAEGGELGFDGASTEEFVAALKDGSLALDEIGDGLGLAVSGNTALLQSFSDLETQIGDGLRAAIADLVASNDDYTDTQQQAIQATTDSAQTIQDLQAILSGLQGEIDPAAEGWEDFTGALSVVPAAADDAGEAIGDVGTEAGDAATEVETLSDAIDRLVNDAFGTLNAEISFERAVDDLEKLVFETGQLENGLDLTSEAARDVAEALSETSEQGLAVAESLAGDGNIEAANAQLETTIGILEAMGVAAGLSADEIATFTQPLKDLQAIGIVNTDITVGGVDEARAAVALADKEVRSFGSLAESATLDTDGEGDVSATVAAATLEVTAYGSLYESATLDTDGEGDALSAIQSVESQLAQYGGTTATATVQVDISGAIASINAVKALIASVGSIAAPVISGATAATGVSSGGNGLPPGFFGALMNGGPVVPGQTYVVGEIGPELLNIDSQGRANVFPNRTLEQFESESGGNTYNFQTYVDGEVDPAELAREQGRMIRVAQLQRGVAR